MQLEKSDGILNNFEPIPQNEVISMLYCLSKFPNDNPKYVRFFGDRWPAFGPNYGIVLWDMNGLHPAVKCDSAFQFRRSQQQSLLCK